MKENDFAKRIEYFLTTYRTKQKRDELAAGVSKNEAYFKVLLDIWKQGDIHPNYAAWVASHAVMRNEKLFKKYGEQLFDFIPYCKTSGEEREILRMAKESEIPEEWEGKVLHNCLSNIENPVKAIAIHNYSMELLDRFMIRYPELENEILEIISSNKPHYAATIQRKIDKFFHKRSSASK
jgi:hypothetical protein